MADMKQDQAILIFKELETLKKGMKQVVGLLGVVVKYIEDQAKPPDVPMATREMLYPDLSGTSAPLPSEGTPDEDMSASPSPSSWRGIFQRKGAV